MNWRRGLFRLWIVGSVLFVIAVASISYCKIKKELSVNEQKFIPMFCGEARGEAGKDYAIKEEREPSPLDYYGEKPNRWETCWYPTSRYRMIYPEYSYGSSDADLASSLRKSLHLPGEPIPWASVGRAAGIAFGIPLVVLIIGTSVVWAFSGFAAKRP